MTELALRDATYEDLLKVPDHLVAELIDGELYTSPRPGSRCARASSVLGATVSNFFDSDDRGPDAWWIVDQPELHLGGNALVPDIAGWRRERVPIYPDAPAFEMAPDWCCEVISPSTARVDRVKKRPLCDAWRSACLDCRSDRPVDRSLSARERQMGPCRQLRWR
jgi:Uma2 family endonuclease